MLEQKGIYAVLENDLSLLEGLEFTPPSSAGTKGDDTSYCVCTYEIYRRLFYSLSGVCTTLYDTRYVRITYQIRMIPGTYCIAICLFVSGWWYHTNVPPVDVHVWRQLHLSAVARCSDSYCIFTSYASSILAININTYIVLDVKFYPIRFKEVVRIIEVFDICTYEKSSRLSRLQQEDESLVVPQRTTGQ